MHRLLGRIQLFALLVTSIAQIGTACLAQSDETLLVQRGQYDSIRAKSILELQLFRRETTALDHATSQKLRLISLNPAVGAWFVLQVQSAKTGKLESFHIENANPAIFSLTLTAKPNAALTVQGNGSKIRCTPWRGEGPPLSNAKRTGSPYVPLCEGTLFLRNKVFGNRTNIEAGAEFLRSHIWGGESIVRFVRDKFYRDAQLEISKEIAFSSKSYHVPGLNPLASDVEIRQRRVISTLLDIGLEGSAAGRMTVGQWYPVAGMDGVFASVFQPRAVAREILKGGGNVSWLDPIEAKATGYMVAFDLSQFDVGYAVGTDHPSLGWSPRPPKSIRPKGLPGPDGIKSPKPLVRLGMLNPAIADKAVATFAAGFKREHGAFKFGDMATFNLGHHYGFIEKGVIFSKLQPGLSTLFGLTDGTIHMKTWTKADDALLSQISFARQNGVPLLETDPNTGLAVPGARVNKWGAGNWSGSAEAELRTLRAGACIVKSPDKKYLLYGYFSTVTPSGMTRVFQAYKCNYAMLLDMNALEHTYLALYAPRDGKIHVQQMVPGMALVNKKVKGGTILPRFIGYADNRDFFYITRKDPRQ